MSSMFLAIYALVCIFSIIYWARIRTPSGGWALLTPAGLTWVIQLGCIAFVRFHHDSVFRLLWLVPLAIFAYLVIGKILYSTGVYRSGL